MTSLDPRRAPPPTPPGLDKWNGCDSLGTVFHGWDRAEEYAAPGDLLHLWQSTLGGFVDETGGSCPNEDPDSETAANNLCACQRAVGQARDFLLRQGWTLFRDKDGGDFEEYWLLPPPAYPPPATTPIAE